MKEEGFYGFDASTSEEHVGDQERVPTPKRVNDPRDRDQTAQAKPSPVGGRIPGVGYFLPARTRSIYGEVINLSYDPWPLSLAPSLDMMQQRYGRSYAKGYRLKDAAKQYLEGLWAARRVPGLDPLDHQLYTGAVTDREWIDFAMTEDPRVLRAWERLNAQTAPIDPGTMSTFDIAAAIDELSTDERNALVVVVKAMRQPK